MSVSLEKFTTVRLVHKGRERSYRARILSRSAGTVLEWRLCEIVEGPYAGQEVTQGVSA